MNRENVQIECKECGHMFDMWLEDVNVEEHICGKCEDAE